MTTDEIDLTKLTEESQQEYEEYAEEKAQSLEEDLLEEYKDKANGQYEGNRDELLHLNIVLSALDTPKSPCSFVRTEPLYNHDFKNMDMLFKSEKESIAVFVECEKSLKSGTETKVEKHFNREEVITGGGHKVGKLVSRYMNQLPEEVDTVLSSQLFSEGYLDDAVREIDESLVCWELTYSGKACRIRQYIPLEEEFPGTGLSEPRLESYIEKTASNGVPYSETLDFISSSSNVTKLLNTIITWYSFKKRHDAELNYTTWSQVLDKTLLNYEEDEKEMLYENVIKYGEACGVVEVKNDHGGILKNDYRIVTRYTKDTENLKDEVYEKIAKHEMQDEYEEKLQKAKLDKYNKLLDEQPQVQSSLDSFDDSDG